MMGDYAITAGRAASSGMNSSWRSPSRVKTSFTGFHISTIDRLIVICRSWRFEVRVFVINGIKKLCAECRQNLRNGLPLRLELFIGAMMLHDPNRVYQQPRRLLINIGQLSSEFFVHQ